MEKALWPEVGEKDWLSVGTMGPASLHLSGLTILVKELQDGRFLGIEEQCCHVIVGLIGTKKSFDACIHVFRSDLMIGNQTAVRWPHNQSTRSAFSMDAVCTESRAWKLSLQIKCVAK